MEFHYNDYASSPFMNPQMFEHVSVPHDTIGPGYTFLKLDMVVPVEFYGGQPVSVVLPETIKLTVRTAVPPIHQQQDCTHTYKSPTLENGMEVILPQFIAPGETVSDRRRQREIRREIAKGYQAA